MFHGCPHSFKALLCLTENKALWNIMVHIRSFFNVVLGCWYHYSRSKCINVFNFKEWMADNLKTSSLNVKGPLFGVFDENVKLFVYCELFVAKTQRIMRIPEVRAVLIAGVKHSVAWLSLGTRLTLLNTFTRRMYVFCSQVHVLTFLGRSCLTL